MDVEMYDFNIKYSTCSCTLKHPANGPVNYGPEDRHGNKSRFPSLMEGKAWVDAGRLAENDPNQSACL